MATIEHAALNLIKNIPDKAKNVARTRDSTRMTVKSR
jgi:hypothetical protein